VPCQAKHVERFAIRAKYMTLEPRVNKYVHYFGNIRRIQDHLCQQATAAPVCARGEAMPAARMLLMGGRHPGLLSARAQVPQVDNTNVDRSLAVIHRTVFTYVRHQALGAGSDKLAAGEPPLTTLNRIYLDIVAAVAGSKAMLRVIRQKVDAASAAVGSCTP